ncbi:UvrD-helicase domain-containing protein [Clostridiisalibacter paucivorans]|uniref:UvrD-helicase domain-containing protein n=1 Tax=Clostridiisalibacter paucivorans TaxID=408753 RepID=UPI00047E8D89|nr:UvrD-helicase domain-containing protein [Clostridiisalibacter paucivorans]
MKLTDSQQIAVDTIDTNMAVNAGAGSGKTKVLVERYINILKRGSLRENKEIDSIVAITFTNKAAAEMKERVRNSIKMLKDKDIKWNRLYNDLDRANISTIHSFCTEILKENPIESNVPSRFNLLDEHESTELLSNITKKIINNGIKKGCEIYDFIEYFTPDSLDGSIYTLSIIENIVSIYKKIRTTGKKFIQIKDITLKNIEGLTVDISEINKIRKNFSFLIEKGSKRSKYKKLEDDIVWERFRSRDISNIDVNLIDEIIYLSDYIGKMKKYQDIVDELSQSVNNVIMIREKYYKKIYEILLDILIELDIEYSNQKRILGLLDYEDLQIKVLELFEDDDILARYHNRFRYVMVDEFQDTDELQKNIIYKLCSKLKPLDRKNLFVVGDPKQSIYGFRGANVDVFYKVMEDINKLYGNETIVLKDNFRTVDTVMDFINDIFQNIMSNKYTPLRYNSRSANSIDVEFLTNEDLKVFEGQSEGDYQKRFEASLIAKRIRKLIKEGYNYDDIAILFRSSSDIDIYEKYLHKYEIPYYTLVGNDLLKRQEIIDIINCLKTINNKYDDLSLLGVLRSPLFGISDETLYYLRKYTDDYIIQSMDTEIEELKVEQKEMLKKAYEIIDSLNGFKYVMTLKELINKILDLTNYMEILLLKKEGKQSIANIYSFIDLAERYEKENNGTINEFIDYIDNLISNGAIQEQEQLQSETDNIVKIMTIHRSKGLEFPVVFIPQMAKRFNLINGPILFNENFGIGIKHPNDLGKLDKDISPIYAKLNEVQKRNDIEENKRVLYVAMTRAEKRLIMGLQPIDKFKYSFKGIIGNNIPKDKCKFTADIELENTTDFTTVHIPKKIMLDNSNKKSIELMEYDNYNNNKNFNRFTITQYMVFNYCNRYFYMTYYKGIPIANDYYIEKKKSSILIDSATRGTIVHNICERYIDGMDARHMIEEELYKYGLPLDKAYIDEIMVYIKNYIYYYHEDFDICYKEKEFYYNIFGKNIYGIIDRINIKDGRAEIIDYKTNSVRNTKSKLRKQYGPQLRLYAKAFQDISNIVVDSASILLLETGEKINIDISNNKIEENLNNIKQFIEFVTTHRDIKDYHKRSYGCKYCKFNYICEIY